MYEIKQNSRKVSAIEIDTYQREISNCNCLEVEAGTNGLCGGDGGHGSRTYIRIEDLCGTDIEVNTTCDDYGNKNGLIIILGGDSELLTTIEALEFIIKALKDGIGGV